MIQNLGAPFMTFTQVNDPETLANVIRTVNQQQSNVLISDVKSEPQTAEQIQVQQPSINEKATEQACTKCGNI